MVLGVTGSPPTGWTTASLICVLTARGLNADLSEGESEATKMSEDA